MNTATDRLPLQEFQPHRLVRGPYAVSYTHLDVYKRQAFAAAVLGLLDDPARRAAMGTRAQAFAAQYDWRRVAPLLNEVYDRLLANRR